MDAMNERMTELEKKQEVYNGVIVTEEGERFSRAQVEVAAAKGKRTLGLKRIKKTGKEDEDGKTVEDRVSDMIAAAVRKVAKNIRAVYWTRASESKDLCYVEFLYGTPGSAEGTNWMDVQARILELEMIGQQEEEEEVLQEEQQ